MNVRGIGSLGVVALVIGLTGDAHAAFDRELENLNRTRSMRILDEFNENNEAAIGTTELSAEQIRRSLKAQQEADAEREAFARRSEGPEGEDLEDQEAVAPTIPRDQLAELLGLQMSSADEQVPLDIKTDIEMRTVRQSNFFERRIDALGETQFSYYPGVHATTRQMGWSYKSDYRMGRFLHMNTPHNDRVDHTWTQALVKTQSKTTWKFASDMTASSVKSEEATIKPSRYMTSYFESAVDYALTPKTTLGLAYDRDTTTYLSDTRSSLDVRNHSFDANWRYDWTPKTTLRGGFTFRMNRPPKGPKTDNINAYNYYLGMNGRFSDKVFYSFRGSMDYSKRSLESSPMQEYFSFAAALTYRYSPKTRFIFNSQRTRVPTATETGSDPDNLLTSLTVSYSLTPKITLSAGESIRIVSSTGGLPTVVVDPDYPSDTFTAHSRQVHWGTTLLLDYKVDPSSSLRLKYAYLDVDSKLKTDTRINHTCEVSYAKKF